MEANLQLNSFQAPLLEESRESLVKGQRQRLLESTSRVHHLDHNPALHTVAQKNQGSKVGSLWELKRYICGSFVVKSEQSSVKSKQLQTNFISFRTLLQRNQRQPRLLSHKYQLQAPAALFLYLEQGYQLIQEHTTSVFLLTCAVFPILM